jgi:hypothetical protein
LVVCGTKNKRRTIANKYKEEIKRFKTKNFTNECTNFVPKTIKYKLKTIISVIVMASIYIKKEKKFAMYGPIIKNQPRSPKKRGASRLINCFCIFSKKSINKRKNMSNPKQPRMKKELEVNKKTPLFQILKITPVSII